MDSIRSYYVSGIVIKRDTGTTRNGIGEKLESFTTHLTISGRIRPLTGKERIASEKLDVISTHRLYCDPADIKETDRVEFNSKTYNVTYVSDPMNMSEFLQIDLLLVE